MNRLSRYLATALVTAFTATGALAGEPVALPPDAGIQTVNHPEGNGKGYTGKKAGPPLTAPFSDH